MVKWASVRSKQLLEIKGIICIHSMVLMIKVTHTMIPELITSWSKNPLRHKTKPVVVEVAAADKVKMLEEKKRWALQGHAEVNFALDTPCLGPVGLKTCSLSYSWKWGIAQPTH
jgi:hypothetical protein